MTRRILFILDDQEFQKYNVKKLTQSYFQFAQNEMFFKIFQRAQN